MKDSTQHGTSFTHGLTLKLLVIPLNIRDNIYNHMCYNVNLLSDLASSCFELNDRKTRQHITGYVERNFEVFNRHSFVPNGFTRHWTTCDETNNPPSVIDAKQCVCDVYSSESTPTFYQQQIRFAPVAVIHLILPNIPELQFDAYNLDYHYLMEKYNYWIKRSITQ